MIKIKLKTLIDTENRLVVTRGQRCLGVREMHEGCPMYDDGWQIGLVGGDYLAVYTDAKL